jgi:opacity protein-like surface antigen
MNFTILVTTAVSITATAFAGGSKEVIAPTQPTAPSLGGWSIGGTYGQFETEGSRDGYSGLQGGQGSLLENFDFDMYTLHIGHDLGTQVAGFDLAAYLEVGFLDGASNRSFQNMPAPALDIDLEIIPITMNLKLERSLYGPVNFYLTGGLGYAFTDASGFGNSESGGGFYAQASAGLIYNVNSQLELLAGGRWLHLSSLDFGDAPLAVELDGAFAWEVGARVNF